MHGTARFTPKRGELHTYRLVHLKHIHLKKQDHKNLPAQLFIDLGFSSFIRGSEILSRKYEEGDIVQFKSEKNFHKLSNSSQEVLYTYQAFVEKVTDGDTLWVRIDLGFDIWIRQKLRLRGLDAPELDTKEGEKVKRFVEGELKNVPSIIITTTKPDKYDRYLSDIWINGANLNKTLPERGLARYMSEVSENNWNEFNSGRF